MASPQDLRSFLKRLEESGQLAYVEREVDPKHELAGVMFKAAQASGPALFFRKIKGKKMPLVANLTASRERLALALETSVEELRETYRQRVAKTIESQTLTSGLCQEVVVKEVDLTQLPVITAHEYDAGPYITAGVVVAKHPKTAVPNLSLHRIHPRGKNKAGIFINPGSDLAQYYRDAGADPLPIAVAIGLHPAFYMAAAIKFPMSMDEYSAAGSLLCQPANLVKCKSVDIEVPAGAEIVLEGEIPQEVRELEGPFGEYPGYYGAGNIEPKEAPIINFKLMTHRRDPLYQALICGPALGHESTYLHCVSREGSVFAATKGVCPQVQAVRIDPSRYLTAIQVAEGRHPGDAALVMAAALVANDHIKYVVLVDSDVNIDSPADIFWAMSTRVDPGRDIYFFPKQRMDALDPSTNRICDKVGIDATIPLEANREGFTRTRIPNLEKIKLEDYLKPEALKKLF